MCYVTQSDLCATAALYTSFLTSKQSILWKEREGERKRDGESLWSMVKLVMQEAELDRYKEKLSRVRLSEIRERGHGMQYLNVWLIISCLKYV